VNNEEFEKTETVVATLRQAIAEAEKQEPLVWMNKYGHVASFKNDEYTAPLYTAPVHASDISQERVDETAKDRHEPYNPMERNADYERGFIGGRADQMKSSVDKAVNRMAQREWVGLTNEEIVGFIAFDGSSLADFIRAIEAKLKEKNHGNT
jgi:hypothetical protein